MATNFSDSTPSAPSGKINVAWQKDVSGNVSANEDASFPVTAYVNTPVNAQVVIYQQIPVALTFPAAAAPSSAVAKVAATASTVYTFSKNGTPFATATFAISGTTATWTQASDATFNGSTDILEIDGPALADATLANVGIVLVGYRT